MKANHGETILDVAIEHDIDIEGASCVQQRPRPWNVVACCFTVGGSGRANTLEGPSLTRHLRDLTLWRADRCWAVPWSGACGGTLACSTCHVIVDQENFDKLEEPSEEELDMLDLAIGLEDTSRLGCQIEMCSELAGIRLAIPDETGDIRGF